MGVTTSLMLLANSRSEPRCAFSDHFWGIAHVVCLLHQRVRSSVPTSVRSPSLRVEGYGRFEGRASMGGSPATSSFRENCTLTYDWSIVRHIPSARRSRGAGRELRTDKQGSSATSSCRACGEGSAPFGSRTSRLSRGVAPERGRDAVEGLIQGGQLREPPCLNAVQRVLILFCGGVLLEDAQETHRQIV